MKKSKRMKRGPKRDSIGRLDHSKTCEKRAKDRRELEKILDETLLEEIDVPEFLLKD